MNIKLIIEKTNKTRSGKQTKTFSYVSLTVIDLSGGYISSVSYESTKPIDKQLEDISINLPEENSFTGLLSQIKGSQISLTLLSNQKITGKLTGLQQISSQNKQTQIVKTFINLINEKAQVVSCDLEEIIELEIIDKNISQDLKHLLEILISSKKKDVKNITIFARGEGKRDILASYVIEMPVWKATYRIIFDKKEEQSIIEGWAIVDNITNEDWKDIELSLVSGLPVSFTYDLYNPIFRSRPEVKIEQETAQAPPIMENAIFQGKKPTRHYHHHKMKEYNESRGIELQSEKNSKPEVKTHKSLLADLFTYEIKTPVTVKRNQSALVSILKEPFQAKRVAVYNESVREKNPMNSILFKNNLGLTLEGGPATIYETNDYLGEAMLETMKPGDEKIIPFAVELSVIVSKEESKIPQNVHHVYISYGSVLVYHYNYHECKYLIKNKTQRKIEFYLEHKKGLPLINTVDPIETTDTLHRFKLELEPEKTTKFVVTQKGEEYVSYTIRTLTEEKIGVWLSTNYLTQEMSQTLLGLVELQKEITQIQTLVNNLKADINEIEQDHGRIRQNLDALRESRDEAQLRQVYVQKFSQDEDRIKAIYENLKVQQDLQALKNQELTTKINNLSFSHNL